MICIEAQECENAGLDESEVYLMLAIAKGMMEFNQSLDNLITMGLVTKSYDNQGHSNGWRLSNKGNSKLMSIIANSQPNEDAKTKANLLTECAKALKEIFPKGKKPGTNYYWADGVALIERRLKIFIKKYGNSYTNEQIIQATKHYVESFNGNYQYMKLLKYFIFKEKLGKAGDVEGESDLLNIIENGPDQPANNDWMESYK